MEERKRQMDFARFYQKLKMKYLKKNRKLTARKNYF